LKLWKIIKKNGLNKLDISKKIVLIKYQLKKLIWILLILKKEKLNKRKKKPKKLLLLEELKFLIKVEKLLIWLPML
jgi:hypothetical protein